MREVYLDYSATTPVKDDVLNEMLPYFKEQYGNPSSLYSIGAKSKEAIEKARSQVSKLINAKAKEVFFTSTGTEADNWAIFGVADALKHKGKHIITSKIEHHALLHTCKSLEKQGFEVTYLDVDKDGIVSPEILKKAIREDTILVSIMLVNNEIGTIEPIKALAAVAKERNILFHTDAVQGLGNLHIDVKDLGVDLMSMSAHKIYGPKGVGALYIKTGVKISSYLFGGAQEYKKRAGTENLAGIVGFGKAAELALEHLDEHIEKIKNLRDYFIEQVQQKISHTNVNGSMKHRHPGNANITFEYIEGEAMLLLLDMKGVYISTGSACSSASLVPSHVLNAIGVPVESIHGSLRFTVGDFTTREDLDYVAEVLVEIVEKLRKISSISEEKGW